MPPLEPLTQPRKLAWLEAHSTDLLIRAGIEPIKDFICDRFSGFDDFRSSFCKQRYDAVICIAPDCSEPDTLALVKWIRSVRSGTVPVMVLTADAEEAEVVDTLYAGADDVQDLTIPGGVLCAKVAALCLRAERCR